MTDHPRRLMLAWVEHDGRIFVLERERVVYHHRTHETVESIVREVFDLRLDGDTIVTVSWFDRLRYSDGRRNCDIAEYRVVGYKDDCTPHWALQWEANYWCPEE